MARGKVRFDAIPRHWEIWRDGVKKSYSTPWTFNLNEGEYSFLFKKAGFLDEEKAFSIIPNKTINVSWEGVSGVTPPAPTPPTPLPEEEPAFIRIDSTPSGARVSIDNTPTDQNTWTGRMQFPPGPHNVKVWGIEGYAETQGTIYAIAGQTVNLHIPMAPLPPEPPPPEPPPEPLPEDEFTTGLTDLMRALDLDVPQFLQDFDAFMGWATETFGTEMPMLQRNAITGELEKAPTGKKILFFVSMSAPIQAAQPALTKAAGNMAATAFLDDAAKNPKATLAMIKAFPKGDLGKFWDSIPSTMLQKKVIEASQRLIFDSVKKNLPLSAKLVAKAPNPTYLAIMTMGLMGIATWVRIDNILFYLSGGVLSLMAAKDWDRAIEASQRAKIQGQEWLDNPALMLMMDAMLLGGASPAIRAMLAKADDDIEAAMKRKAEEGGGTIGITTTPTGASIFVNDRLFKYPSNTVVDELAPGTYKIRLMLKHHIEHETTIDVEEDVQKEIVYEFEEIPTDPAPGSGRIEWETKDRITGKTVGASWYINGRLEKDFSTGLALDLEPKTYEFRWTAIGYEDYVDTIPIEKDKIFTVVVKMDKIEDIPEPPPTLTCEVLGYHTDKPDDGQEYEQIPVRGLLCWAIKEPTTGFIEILSTPTAEVWLLGEKIADKTPFKREFEQGFYTFVLKAEGYLDEPVKVWIEPEDRKTQAITMTAEELEPPTRKVWRLDINSFPQQAKILINYQFMEKYTPDFIFLDPGTYLVTISKSGYEDYNELVPLGEI